MTLGPVLHAAVALLGLLVLLLTWALVRTRRALRAERSRRQSQSTRYGRLTEQFAPFMEAYPHDPARFRFLGSPVDGVQFNDDEVLLVEFKAGRSRLTPNQRRVRDLVEAGRVGWLELRVREGSGGGRR